MFQLYSIPSCTYRNWDWSRNGFNVRM